MNTEAIPNLTADGNYTTIQKLFCRRGLHGKHQKIFFAALNSTLATTAFLGNFLIIVALKKVSSLHPPSKLLLACLAMTDLCVGLISHPLRVAYLTSPDHSERCYYLFTLSNILGVIFGGVSLMTIAAISVDRLLALSLGIQYRHVVTLRRIRIFVAIFWFFAITSALVQIYSIRANVIVITCITTFVCAVTSSFCYMKIYLALRHHQNQIQDHVHQEQPNGGVTSVNIPRYRKTVSSALWVLMTLVTCYLPYCVVAIFDLKGVSTQLFYLAWERALSFFMINSTLNPFLYCWKMRELRQAVKDTIKQNWWYSS